jgi:hypothetical protein
LRSNTKGYSGKLTRPAHKIAIRCDGFNLEAVRPLAKAQPRNESSQGGRKRKKLAILIDTHEKKVTEEEEKQNAVVRRKKSKNK